MANISDDELVSICISEIENSAGYTSGELSQERADAMDRYLGEPYGDEQDDRSKFLTREVYETIEGILPSLVRIFTEADNIVEFEPTGPEDEDQAEQETDLVQYVWATQNRSFYNLYTGLKDALLSKTAIFKTWAEKDDAEEREEYRGLDEIEFGQLMEDSEYEREIIEHEVDETGINVTFKTKRDKTEIKVCAVPPEEFGVSGDSRSPYAKDSQFVFHRTRKSYSELIAEGYDKAFLDSLPSNDDVETEERLARRHLTDESDILTWHNDVSTRMFWVTECYIHIDRDDDGISELLRVTIATGAYSGGGGKLMDVEEVDRIPFSTAPPVILTHKFFGFSIADLVIDIQRQNTSLLRQVFDNTYQANNGQTAVNTDYVNEDDMLTRRPGGMVRFDGDMPWNAVVGPIPHNQLPQQTYDLFERLDERQKRRTGYGDDIAALDVNALSNINTGVAAMAFEMSRSKLELIARVIAEVAFKPLFQDIRELLMKNQNKEMTVKLRGQWVPVNPGEWRTRENSTVKVGIGQVSRERRIMGYQAIMERQDADMQAGAMGTLMLPENLYETRKRWIKSLGFEPSLFYTDPQQMPPPQPQQDPAQDALMMQAQAMMVEAETKRERNQLDAAKMQAEVQLKAREQDLKLQEQELKAEIAQLTLQLSAMKAENDTDTKVASLELQMEKQDVENRLKEHQMRLDAVMAERDREVDLYKVQMDSLVKMMQQYGMDVSPEVLESMRTDQAQRDAEDAQRQEQKDADKARREAESSAMRQATESERNELRRWMGELMAQNQALAEQLAANQPKPTRKMIRRDASGLIMSIEDEIG